MNISPNIQLGMTITREKKNQSNNSDDIIG